MDWKDKKKETRRIEPETILLRLEQVLGELYDVSDSFEIRKLKYSENLNFLLEDYGRGLKRVIRVNRKGYHTAAELDSELLWMKTISETTDLKIPNVIKGQNGELIQILNFEDQPDDFFFFSMCSFLNGTGMREITGEELLSQFTNLGRATATLHNQVINWDDANGLDRFSWDYEDLIGRNSRWGYWRTMEGLSDYEIRLISEAETKMELIIQHYGKSPEKFGLIHADLNINNLLVENGKLEIIDFDDCGYGWFLYDLSTVFLEYENMREIRELLFSGYSEIRRLTPEDLRAFPSFVMMRRLVIMGWLGSRSDSDTAKVLKKNYIEKTIRLCRRYLEDKLF